MFPLNEWLPCRNSNSEAKIFCDNAPGEYPLMGVYRVKPDGKWYSAIWDKNGAYFRDHGQDELDILPPEPTPPVWEIGKPYPTRGGKTAYLLKTDAPGRYPLIGYMEGDLECSACSWTSDGIILVGYQNPADLVPPAPPQPERKTVWMNLYKESIPAYQYDTKEEADAKARADRVACKELTYTPGEGLSSASQ